MNLSIQIAGRTVGDGRPVFVIAEVGINHNGDMRRARELIDSAAAAGADAVKLQTYVTEKRVAKDSPIYGILKQCELSFAQQRELFAYGAEKGIVMFSTPFDDESVAFLESIDTPCYKIASFDIVNTALLRAVCSRKRTVIVSRGMASNAEIDAAVGMFRKEGVPFAILHCVSAYPVPASGDVNLATIVALKARYGCPVGFSDHTRGIDASVYAVPAGASVIEKHFTLSKKDEGPDHALSTEPTEFKTMIERIKDARTMMGRPVDGPIAAEQGILQYRRVT